MVDTNQEYFYALLMQIDLTAEQEAQLSQIADQEGREREELAREVFSRGLAAEAHFIAAVKIGQDCARRADFVDQSEVWAQIENILHS